MNIQIIRAYSVHGRYNASQNMINPFERAGFLNCHNISDIFNDTDFIMISCRIGTYLTYYLIGYVPAGLAEENIFFHLNKRLCETPDLVIILFQEMKCKT